MRANGLTLRDITKKGLKKRLQKSQLPAFKS